MVGFQILLKGKYLIIYNESTRNIQGIKQQVYWWGMSVLLRSQNPNNEILIVTVP